MDLNAPQSKNASDHCSCALSVHYHQAQRSDCGGWRSCAIRRASCAKISVANDCVLTATCPGRFSAIQVKQEVPNGCLLNLKGLLSQVFKARKYLRVTLKKSKHILFIQKKKKKKPNHYSRHQECVSWHGLLDLSIKSKFLTHVMPAAKSKTCMRAFIWLRFSFSCVYRWGLSPASGCAWIIVIWQMPSISTEMTSASYWDPSLSHFWMQLAQSDVTEASNARETM